MPNNSSEKGEVSWTKKKRNLLILFMPHSWSSLGLFAKKDSGLLSADSAYG